MSSIPNDWADRFAAAYAQRRPTFPANRTGTLTKEGDLLAFEFLVGYIAGLQAIDPSFNPPATMIASIRGVDGWLKLKENAKMLAPAKAPHA